MVMRLGRIPWINCYPVYAAMDRGIVPVSAELISGTAADLNDLLAAGELDVSVVSAVEYARNAAAYHLLPDLAISTLIDSDSVGGSTNHESPELRYGSSCSSCSASIGGGFGRNSPRCAPNRATWRRYAGSPTKRCWSSETPR